MVSSQSSSFSSTESPSASSCGASTSLVAFSLFFACNAYPLSRIGTHATATHVKSIVHKFKTRRAVGAISPTAIPMVAARSSPKHAVPSPGARHVISIPEDRETQPFGSAPNIDTAAVMSPSDVPFIEPSSRNVLAYTHLASGDGDGDLVSIDERDGSESPKRERNGKQRVQGQKAGDEVKEENEGVRGFLAEIAETFAG